MKFSFCNLWRSSYLHLLQNLLHWTPLGKTWINYLWDPKVTMIFTVCDDGNFDKNGTKYVRDHKGRWWLIGRKYKLRRAVNFYPCNFYTLHFHSIQTLFVLLCCDQKCVCIVIRCSQMKVCNKQNWSLTNSLEEHAAMYLLLWCGQ